MNSKKITLAGMTIAAFLMGGLSAQAGDAGTTCACSKAKKETASPADKTVTTDEGTDKKEGSCGEGACGSK